MICALRRLPVTDFTSDHHLDTMPEGGSISPQLRREDPFSMRPTPSKEELELAQHLVGHSQGQRNGLQRQNDIPNNSPSPYDYGSPGMTPGSDRMSQRSPGESVDSYAPVIPQSDNIPSGQVCRYAPLISFPRFY